MATSLPVRHAGNSSVLSIVIAVLLILAGLAAIFLPFLAGIAISIAVAWLLLFAGVIHLFFGWHTRSAGAVIWKISSGSHTSSRPSTSSIIPDEACLR